MQAQKGSNRKRSGREIFCFSEIGAQGPWAQGPRDLGPFLLNDSARQGFVVQLKLCCRLPLHVSWIRYNAQAEFKLLASRLEMITFIDHLLADLSLPSLAP